MIEHLIEKTDQQRQLEAWDTFLEMVLNDYTKRLIYEHGIRSVTEYLETKRWDLVTPASITRVSERLWQERFHERLPGGDTP